MSKGKLWSFLLFALIIGAPLLYLGSCVREELKFDSCLDRGGSWNHAAKSCERARN
jgi:hypothetical protein